MRSSAVMRRWVQTGFDFVGTPREPSAGDTVTPAGDSPSDTALPQPMGPLVNATRQALENRLAQLMACRVRLVVTNNRSSLLHAREGADGVHVRLHHMFLDAPDPLVKALARYLTRGDKTSARRVDAFIEENRGKIAAGDSRLGRQVSLRTRGHVHDLQAMFDALNETWFGSAIEASVTWGRRTRPLRGRRRSSLRLGSYVFQDRLIRMHPVLDQRWVPDFFVRYVLFHEMLHVVTPPEERAGQRHYHGRAFRARERSYPDYQRAVAWEREHLDRLLAS